jgi:hypothetical protein
VLPLTEPISTCAADVDFDVNDINVDELEVGDMGELQIDFDGDNPVEAAPGHGQSDRASGGGLAGSTERGSHG